MDLRDIDLSEYILGCLKEHLIVNKECRMIGCRYWIMRFDLARKINPWLHVAGTAILNKGVKIANDGTDGKPEKGAQIITTNSLVDLISIPRPMQMIRTEIGVNPDHEFALVTLAGGGHVAIMDLRFYLIMKEAADVFGRGEPQFYQTQGDRLGRIIVIDEDGRFVGMVMPFMGDQSRLRVVEKALLMAS
jgi:hypothetical protein